MIPREPQRRPQMGFLYVSPYRIQGLSIAGEESVVQVPELNICFDIGLCPRPVLASPFVALTHGHMDHSAGIAYYFSQRWFQGMGVGTIVCPTALAEPIHNVMRAWVDLEAQRTPYELKPLASGEEIEIKPKHFLRAFATNHTVPSLGFVVIERRSKLRAELLGLPQEKLLELKGRGEDITQTLEIPLVCYTGDTAWGECFDRPDVLEAKVLITECTFLEAEHRGRAQVGKHLHLDDIVRLLEKSKAQYLILTHLSRRTHMGEARKQIELAIPAEHAQRVLLLMDSRGNRARYDQQVKEAGDMAEATQEE